jgi:putative ABC transport system permease protein
MTLWKLIIRETRRRPGRVMLTLLSIAIGTAAVVSVSLGTRATRAASRQMYQSLSGRAALEVVAEGNGDFAQTLGAALEAVPGVRAAVPSVQRYTILRCRQERLTVFMLGIDPQRDRLARDYALREGRFFEDGQGAMLEAGFAAGAGIKLGDEVTLRTPRGGLALKHIAVVGLLEPRGVAGFKGGGTLFLPLGLAQRWFTRPGQVNSIDLVLDESADEPRVRAEVSRQLPVGVTVHPAAARSQFAEDTMLNIETGLRFASTLTVVLAIFVIANTFLMNVSERRKQFAVLRAIGATRGQIVRMIVTEAMILGAAGTALGCVAGAAGGSLLLEAITQMFSESSPPMTYSADLFLLAAVLGPTVAVAAAYVPARLTMRISPLEAMRPLVMQDGGPLS